MALATPEANKEAYRVLHDRIHDKRINARSPIRRHAHNRQHAIIAETVPVGATVLDAGCGEGDLSMRMAKRGCLVTGSDLSAPNVAACKEYAAQEGVTATFVEGDVERLPFPDKSFDYVVSSHVLEHIPDFVQGVRELNRVARKGVIVAIPTCLNPCAYVLLGRGKYWTLMDRRAPYAIVFGKLRVLWALVTGKEGVNEGYAGRADLVHIWRFPWRGKRLLEEGGLTVVRQRASTFILPYLPFLLPVAKFFERFDDVPILKHLGYGTTYVCEPGQAS